MLKYYWSGGDGDGGSKDLKGAKECFYKIIIKLQGSH